MSAYLIIIHGSYSNWGSGILTPIIWKFDCHHRPFTGSQLKCFVFRCGEHSIRARTREVLKKHTEYVAGMRA